MGGTISLSSHEIWRAAARRECLCVAACSAPMKTPVLLLAVAFLLWVHASRPCPCPRIMDPVCGSDGVTYGNSCVFRCAQRIQPGLTMVTLGKC